jgi:ribonuclease HI
MTAQRRNIQPDRATRKEKITIYCDGACSGNQFGTNIGGWGAILIYKGTSKELFGGERNTTNQRMEITACIKALQQLKRRDLPVEIRSDSAYLVNCMQEKWYEQWQRNGWKNARKEPVENKDLWIQLLRCASELDIRFAKVSGHAGVALNERADTLARRGIREAH